MFCPKCGTLAHPNPSGNISCHNYKCGYVGPANVKVKDRLGREIDLARFSTQTEPEERDYSVIKDSDLRRMYKGQAECPRCPNTRSFTYLEQTLYGADDDIVKTILFCEECGKDFKKD